MTEISRERREELMKQFAYSTTPPVTQWPTVDEIRALLADSAWRERVERQVRELANDVDFGDDREVAVECDYVRDRLRAIVDP